MPKTLPVPQPPSYLSGDLARRFRELAPDLVAMGAILPQDADLLARYVVTEHQYLRASQKALQALASADPDEAGRWSSIQGKLLQQVLALGAELGLTPQARRSRGLFPPKVR